MKIKTRKRVPKLAAVLLTLCMTVTLLSVPVFAADPPTKRDTYNVYSDEAIAGGSDSQVYANTVTVKRGGYDGDEFLVLHYVYSPNAIHSNELMKKIREGLEEPYKSLVPEFESESSGEVGFLRVSQDQEKYESMDLDWTNVAFVAAALSPNTVLNVSTYNNSDTAISVTDISVLHADEEVVSKDQLLMEDFYEHLSELGYLRRGGKPGRNNHWYFSQHRRN